MMPVVLRWTCAILVACIGYLSAINSDTIEHDVPYVNGKDSLQLKQVKDTSYHIDIQRPIKVKHYFRFMDSIISSYDSITSYELNEHLIVRANSWIIDTLKNTDYYLMKARDSFCYDQKQMIALPKGNSLHIPNAVEADSIWQTMKNTWIDINIPEYKLRIYEDTILRYEILVRVGRNEKKYLEMSGRVQDLKTKTGTGEIVRYFKDPIYANPVTDKVYHVTKRDDLEVTKLPQIPFIETEINGIRNGQLIHPTTNPETLGKAYSNGCIGTRESDAWVIYYHAPIGTKIQIRYDLNVTDEHGEPIALEDIYNRFR